MIPNTISVLLVGDSHVHGYDKVHFPIKLAQPVASLDVLLEPRFVGPAYAALEMVVTFPDGREGLNPSIQDALKRWPGFGLKERPLVAGSTIQKELLLSFGTGLGYYDPTFDFADRGHHAVTFRQDIDFLVPDRPDLPIDPRCTLVPFVLIREMFEALLVPMGKALALLNESYSGHLWVLGTPPPAEDNSTLLDMINDRAKRASQPPVDFPSSSVLLKTWLVATRCVEDLCKRSGCKFIDCAPIATEGNGYLKPEFVHDGIHGNHKYIEAITNHVVLKLVAAAVGQSSVHTAAE